MSDKAEVRTEELLRQAREFTDELGGLLSTCVQADDISPNAKIPYKARVLREALLHRTWELAEAACESFENARAISAFVLTRAAFETAALLFVLHKRIDQAVVAGDLGDLDESVLMRMLFGRRDDPSLQYQAVNVLTCIQHLDQYVANEDDEGVIKRHFDGLCEFAHPNWPGTMNAYCRDVGDRRAEFGSDCGRVPVSSGVISLRIAVSIAGNCHRQLSGLEGEFRELCERSLGNTESP